MPGRLRTNRSRILPTKPLFSCARVQDARSRHGASQTRGLRRARAARRAQGGIGDRPASCGALSRGAGPSAVDAYGLPGAGRHWCAQSRLGHAYAPPHCPLARRGAGAGMRCVGAKPPASGAPSVGTRRQSAPGARGLPGAGRHWHARSVGCGALSRGAGRRWYAACRLRDGAVGRGQHRPRSQLRREGTNEPVHSDISPLRCCYRN